MQKFNNIILIISLLLFCQFSLVGQNLVTNGDFQSGDSDWTKQTGWSIIDLGGNNWVAHSDGTQSSGSLFFQSYPSLDHNATYSTTFTISNYSAGQIRIKYTNNDFSENYNANGSYTYSWNQSGEDYNFVAVFEANSNFIGDIDNVTVELASINVTAPNGGESWLAGSTQTISWNDNINENVKIELYKGGSFHSIVSTVTASDGAKHWDIPVGTPAASDYTIRVSSLLDEVFEDFSDAEFSIFAPSINVLSPNGGESWQAGSTQTITWTDDLTGNVRIELYTDGAWNSEIISSTPSDSSYIWSVPYSISTDCKIKVSAVSYPDIFDFSAQPFTIHVDFQVNLIVSDNCDNSQNLIFGTASDAQDCFDPLYDLYSPPPAPLGAFDTRFVSCSEGLMKDIRASNLDDVTIWDVEYQAASGCDNVSFSWDPGQLAAKGNFTLIDFATGGSLVNIDMRTNTSYADIQEQGLGHLQILFNYSVIVSTNIQDGFNIISLPLEVEDNHYKSLYPNAADGSLFGFDGSYYDTDTVHAENGYWLRFEALEVVDIEGLEIPMMELDLISGWNMIGGPACDFPYTSIIDPGGIIIPGTLNGFNGAYFNADTLKQGLGYWIRTNASGTITLDCAFAENLPKGSDGGPFLVDLTQFNSIEIEDNETNGQSLYFGGNLDENVGIESFSLPPLPLSGLFDARIKGGYRLSESDEIEIQIQSENYPLKVKMTGAFEGNTYGYLLKEFAGNAQVGEREISDGMEIIISNENVNLLKIGKVTIVPASFVLEQNYPNPFNPVTSIIYGLPVKGDVILKVYNSIGQEIVTLVNEEKAAGTYEVNFDATNFASGIYFYSIKARNLETGVGEVFVETKKMILLK